MALNARVPTTIQVLRNYILKAQDDDAQDDKIFVLANSAIDRVERYIGGPVLARTLTETLSGKGASVLWTQSRPLVSITSITVDGIAISSTYTVDLRSGLISLTSGAFAAGVANVVIVLRAGYETASLPDDLLEAFLAYVKWLYDEKETGTLGRMSVSVGAQTVSATIKLPESIRLALDPYRDTRF